MRWYPTHKDPRFITGICESCGDPQLDEPKEPLVELPNAELFWLGPGGLRLLHQQEEFLAKRHPNLLARVDAMTAYAEDREVRGTDQDRNHSFYACLSCAADYRAYWKERWDEYNSGRGC